MSISKGVYSLYNGWIKKPEKQDIPDTPDITSEYIEWETRAQACNTIEEIDNFLDDVYKLRQNGLLTDGEFGKGNLIFKELRNNNILQQLKDKKVELENKEMSLGEDFVDTDILPNQFIDMDIYDQLTPEQQAYVDKWDIPIKHEDGRILCGDEEYDSLEDFKADLDYSIDETDKLGLDEGIIEEASEEDIRAKALADYLDISFEAIDSEDYNTYSCPEGEYLVLDDTEADEYASDMIVDLFDDIGLDSFTDDFAEYIINNCVDEDFIQEFIDEEIEYYADQENDRDMVSYLTNLSDIEALDYIRDLFGGKDFGKWLVSQGAIDMDAVVEEALSADGRGHFISSYDGDEIELGNGLYAYRIG